jgi:uncharacterized membrane protein YphA (DoxX/SURF4 family)
VSRRWASGGPRSPVAERPKPPVVPVPESTVPQSAVPQSAVPQSAAPPAAVQHAILDRVAAITAEWAPTAGRILLGVVFAWFGYHELLNPGQWTQYVPVISESSSLAMILVLAHGWVLLMLAAALVAGIAPRIAAAIASVVMLEIVIALIASGWSDTALRDVGVLGLAVCLTGVKHQRLVLRD